MHRAKHGMGKKVMGIILSALVLVGSSALTTKAADIPREVGVPDFTAMSYNVKGEVAYFNELYHTSEEWKAENRSQKQLEMLLKYSPDVLGVSEETYEFRRTFYNHLPGYDSVGEYLFTPDTFFSPLFSNTNLPDANRVYFKRSVFDYLGSDTIWLHEGNVQEVGVIEGETNVRGATMVALRFKETNEKFVISNTHLGLNDDIANRQMEILVRETEAFAKQHGISAILYMGDYNLGYTAVKSLATGDYQCIWDTSVTSHNQPGMGGSWVDHIYVNNKLRLLDRLSLDASEWDNSDSSSDHDPLLANVCFSSYIPRGNIASNTIKTNVSGDRLVIQSGTIDGLGQSNGFVMFYDANNTYVGATQLIARQDTNGSYYISDSAYIPSGSVRANLKIDGGQTYGNIWRQ